MKKILRCILSKEAYVTVSNIKTYIGVHIKLFNMFINKNRNKVIIIDTPLYGNMGDQAITIAEQTWIKNDLPTFKEFLFTVNEIKLYNYKTLNLIKKYINPNDILFLQGGGHFGDLYIDSEMLKREVILNFMDNKIIIFPSTMNFSNTKDGEKQKNITKEIYDKHDDLTLILREEKSFNDAKKTFNNINLILNPDTVFYLCGSNIQLEILKNIERKNILVCFRKDKESFFSIKDKNKLVNDLKCSYENILEKDTNVDYGIKESNRKNEFLKMVRYFSNSKVVITDRYHGMIFSILSKTPCIVLRSLDHKIVESLKWIDKFNVVEYVEDLNDIVQKLEVLLNEDIDISKYDNLNKQIVREFVKLNDLIKLEGANEK